MKSHKIVWELPIKTVSESNCSEHWTIKSKRHRNQQYFVRALFYKTPCTITLPCIVTMTRLAARALDEDNLPPAFKWIKDQIAACLFPEKVVMYRQKNGKFIINKGHADASPLVTWKYSQEISRRLGVRIEIECLQEEKID